MLSEHSLRCRNDYYTNNKDKYDYNNYLWHVRNRQTIYLKVKDFESIIGKEDKVSGSRLLFGILKLKKEQAIALTEALNFSLVEWAWDSRYVYELFDEDWTDDERDVILNQCKWTSEESILYREMKRCAEIKRDSNGELRTACNTLDILEKYSACVSNIKNKEAKNNTIVKPW